MTRICCPDTGFPKILADLHFESEWLVSIYLSCCHTILSQVSTSSILWTRIFIKSKYINIFQVFNTPLVYDCRGCQNIGIPVNLQELFLRFWYPVRSWDKHQGVSQEYRYGAHKIGAQLEEAARGRQNLCNGSLWRESILFKIPDNV